MDWCQDYKKIIGANWGSPSMKETFYPDHDPAVTSVGCGIMFEI
jgi:hypothetical protein